MSGTPIARDEYPGCFGCGHENDRGLRMSFVRTGEASVECRYRSEGFLRGPDGVIHGGIQATLLDEVLGVTAALAFPDEDAELVTAEFSLRYRGAVPTEEEVVIEGRLKERDGRNVWVEGAIRTPDGKICTTAEARWVRVGTHG